MKPETYNRSSFNNESPRSYYKKINTNTLSNRGPPNCLKEQFSIPFQTAFLKCNISLHIFRCQIKVQMRLCYDIMSKVRWDIKFIRLTSIHLKITFPKFDFRFQLFHPLVHDVADNSTTLKVGNDRHFLLFQLMSYFTCERIIKKWLLWRIVINNGRDPKHLWIFILHICMFVYLPFVQILQAVSALSSVASR